MLTHHELDASHKASVHALCHASILKGMTATAATVPSMTNSVGDQKICICIFIAEHDLSFTKPQPLV